MIPTDPNKRRELAQKVAEDLNGSSGVYDDSVAEAHGLEDNELEELAEEGEIVRCEGCGWWVELSEVDDDNRCEDCTQDEEE